jgi:hypothetical protein
MYVWCAPRSAYAVAAIVTLALFGCAAAPERLPPVFTGISADQARALVERWEEDWRAFPGLRAAVDISVVRKGWVQRSAGVLLLSRDRFRFEVVTPLGFPALVVTAGPERIVVFSPSERRAWTAGPTAEAMNRWIGVPLQLETLIRILAGRVPAPPEGVAVRVTPDPSPHIVFERGAVRQRVWVTPGGEPARLQLENGERVTATFEWAVNGRLQSLVVEAPGQSTEVHLRYISAEPTTPTPDAFELLVPPGVTTESLD